MDGYDNEIDFFSTTKLDSKRWKTKKVEKKKAAISEEEMKKKAAIDCLTAVSEEVSTICLLGNFICSGCRTGEWINLEIYILVEIAPAVQELPS